jgi:hypothetical protein
MAYCIMRTEKRSRGGIYGLQIEANRTADDHAAGRDFLKSKINWDRTDNNYWLVRSQNFNEDITKIIKNSGARERKDSVVMLDTIYTASKEFFADKSPQEIKKYFSDCLAFHCMEYCQSDKNRVLNAVVHVDESTIHMHVASVPILVDSQGVHLSAKRVMGNRAQYRQHQDMFHTVVGIEHGLERGDPEKHVKHLKTEEYDLTQKIKKSQQKISDNQKKLDKIKLDCFNLSEYKNDARIAADAINAELDELAENEAHAKNRAQLMEKRVEAARWMLNQVTQQDMYKMSIIRQYYPEIYDYINKVVADFEQQQSEQQQRNNRYEDDLEL